MKIFVLDIIVVIVVLDVLILKEIVICLGL